MNDKELHAGFIRSHVLHHAAHQPVFGLGIIEELARHGYKLSPGTLYPLPHALERKGYLRLAKEQERIGFDGIYRATARGRQALTVAKSRARELFEELLEDA
jgi:DNA-binding PadR family transcriptional regulator